MLLLPANSVLIISFFGTRCAFSAAASRPRLTRKPAPPPPLLPFPLPLVLPLFLPMQLPFLWLGLLLSGQDTPPRPGGGGAWVQDGWVGWPQIAAFWATGHPPAPGGGVCAFPGFWVCGFELHWFGCVAVLLCLPLQRNFVWEERIRRQPVHSICP